MSAVEVDNITHRATGDSVPTEYVVHGSAKAWVRGNVAATVAESFNISSGVDNGVGDYTYNLTASVANSNFPAFGAGTASSSAIICTPSLAGTSAGGMLMFSDAGSAVDRNNCWEVFGELA